MPKAGRPKLPKLERKRVTLSVRLKTVERREVDAAAKAAGVGVSEWAREVLLTAARTRLR